MKVNEEVERAVRKRVREFVESGGGIAVGGALGVDFFALDEALIINRDGRNIKVFLPTDLETYIKYNREMVRNGRMTSQQAEALIEQLSRLLEIAPDALVAGDGTEVNRESFFARNSRIVDAADILAAFRVISELSDGPGTLDTIEKAREKGIPVEISTFDLTTREGELSRDRVR